jgi:hypothetical protein
MSISHLPEHGHHPRTEQQAYECEHLPPEAAPPQQGVHHEITREHLDARGVDEHAGRNGAEDTLREFHAGYEGLQHPA